MLDNNKKFNELREKYSNFIYEKFEIQNDKEFILFKFYFTIDGLKSFCPTIKILKKDLIFNDKKLENIEAFAFHIGLIELISYWKSVCSPNVIIKCGYLNEEQKKWFKKLYFYGLGELFFTNGIKTNLEEFMNITCQSEKKYNLDIVENQEYKGYLIPIGGGKDSVVTLELLKKEQQNNLCLIVNPKPVTLECASKAGYENKKIVEVIRKIDDNLIDLNKKGFINGHTPFSSLLAFLSYFIGYITEKKYVALSNESSSNESNVVGEKINHQYSKSFEFENNFREYVKKYLDVPVEYFSFLRPLNELQIAYLFSKQEKYFEVFKSCNVGSKGETWKWCCNCAKCLFVYIILSPFLYKDKILKIFGEDLYEKQELLTTFIELTGNGETKPFECVGTFEEVNYALMKTIQNLEEQQMKFPYLLEYYKNNYLINNKKLLDNNFLKKFNNDNNLNGNQKNILKEEIDCD